MQQTLVKRIKAWTRHIFSVLRSLNTLQHNVLAQLDALVQLELVRELEHIHSMMRAETSDNPAVSGFKVYSQCDEDGVIAEIMRRLKISSGTFVEIGCGNGLEKGKVSA